MMKHNNLFLWLLGLTVCWLASCSEEDGRVTYPYSCPEISELQFSTPDQTTAADSLYFSVKIHDPQTPLSTLEVKLMTGETLVSSQSIRTKGTDVSIVEKGIYIPFEAGLEENQEAKVILTAINVEGSEVTQTFDFHITRPQIPEVLYLHYNGEVVEMNNHRSANFQKAIRSFVRNSLPHALLYPVRPKLKSGPDSSPNVHWSVQCQKWF
jgi:hypothetical protein